MAPLVQRGSSLSRRPLPPTASDATAERGATKLSAPVQDPGQFMDGHEEDWSAGSRLDHQQEGVGAVDPPRAVIAPDDDDSTRAVALSVTPRLFASSATPTTRSPAATFASPTHQSFEPTRQVSRDDRTPARTPIQTTSRSPSESRKSPASTRSSSLRRKPPPPLDLSPTSSPRSLTQIETTAGPVPVRWTAGSANKVVPETPSREQDRQEPMSNLVGFTASTAESPRINLSLPSTSLDLSHESEGDDDDTIGSGISYLSSSTSSSKYLDADDQPRPYQPSALLASSTGTGAGAQGYSGRPYQGVGLGLPFSVSAAANLSSLASPAPLSASHPLPIDIPSPSRASRDPFHSPRPGERNGDSPVVDRGQLIGLGELATPRWTSAALERRWGAPVGEEALTNRFDVHEPMPSTTRHASVAVESPTAARQTVGSLHDSSSANRPFGNSGASSLQPQSLLPHSTSASSISTQLSPAGLLNFGQDTASTFGALEYTPASPGYSLDAASPDLSRPERTDKMEQTRATEGAPKRTTRTSGVATTNDDAARWYNESEKTMVGLGFDYETAEARLVRDGPDNSTTLGPSQRRVSQGSTTPGTGSKRSSHRASIDGKAALKHRRQSASKSSFAHLPPSPAAASSTHSLSASTTSLPPPTFPQIDPYPHASHHQTGSSQSTPAARTPDHSRLSRHSFHSHHSSPSLVAASILRHTRDLEGIDLEIEKAAAADEGTAEALRKLDGLSSPKMTRIASNSSSIESRSRKSSRNFVEMPPNLRRDSEERIRRRTRSSLADAGDSLNVDTSGPGTTSGTPTLSSPSMPPLPSSAGFAPKSPLYDTGSSGSASRPQPQRINSGTEIPFPSTASPYKRGSSSSASYTFAGSTSASGSHDSTSGTSVTSRSVASKARRSSAGSDASSAHSGADPRPGVERMDSAGEGDQLQGIPPVPPLPKDWETYRPTASTTSAPLSASTATTVSSISFPSPKPEYDVRRPSLASSLENSFRSSPRAPPMESNTSKEGSKEAASSNNRRKWSISSAFHKASKSPKSTGGIKESSSFSDLQAPSQRDRKASFGPRLGLGEGTQLPKRMASSTSDIASLASSRSEYSQSGTGSIGRNSIRSERASITARTRTSSQSSTNTARMANSQPASQVATPAVVTTSPGRSRSSLINPRRTPSSIPFFSRKASHSTESSNKSTTPSPNIEKGSAEDRSGRKSILGLNFLRSSTSKRDKDKSPIMASTSSKLPTVTNSLSSSNLHSDSLRTDEFGRRAGEPSDALTRKRGKTLSSVDARNDDVFGTKAQTKQLPPFQMPALSTVTKNRVDALNASQSSTASARSFAKAPPSPSGSVLQTPRTRTSKLQDSIRGNLPTIAGSPSTYGARLAAEIGSTMESRSASQNPSPSGSPPPKSRTPTKIPRLGRIGTAPSSPKPRTSAASRDNSPSNPPPVSKDTWRRSSSFGGAGDVANPLSASLTSSLAHSANDNDSTSEFGSVNREPGLQHGEKTLSTRRRLESDVTAPSGIPRSTSTTGATLASARDQLSSSTSSSRQGTALPRIARRSTTVEEAARNVPASAPVKAPSPARSNQPRLSSLSASASRSSTQALADPSSTSTKRLSSKSSETNMVPRRTSAASSLTGEPPSSSRSSRNLSSRGAIPTRVSKSTSAHSASRISSSGTDSGRSSSASHREVDEEEVRADEEMGAYVRRQYSKKLSAGMSEDAIRKLFEFPDPTDPLPPLDANDALSLYSRFLSPYEKEEIRDFRKVYFVGPNCDKKPASKDHTTNNYGYDDERGDYLLVPNDHLHYRYEVINVLGKGSFGQVLQCRDHKTGEMVAIKIIRNKKRFHHQALVEIKVLENLVKWDPNEKHFVIRMIDSFTFRGHLCIVTELLSINLYELVKANSFAGFSTTLIRRFTVQILGSLSLLRHHRVVHCDLKPENILLKHPAKSAIKVIDFGSSCFEHEKVYTYIQSRFYRSPEVILGMNYHMGIDMWSLGCIIAEMYTGYPIFPGENEQEQLACIMEVMGLPDKYLVDRSSRKRLFFDSTGAPRPVVNSKGRRRRPGSKTLAQVLKTDDELFIDFIAKCLMWDPDRRLKPDPAMRHPWITQARGTNSTIPPSIPPPRATRASGLPTSSSTRFTSNATSSISSSSISTPLKKLPPPASTSTAPLPRSRTFSTASSIPASTTRLGSKASLGLPPSSRYQVKS